MKSHGLFGAELAAAIVSFLGIGVTAVFLPETKGKTLEELNEALPAKRTLGHRRLHREQLQPAHKSALGSLSHCLAERTLRIWRPISTIKL